MTDSEFQETPLESRKNDENKEKKLKIYRNYADTESKNENENGGKLSPVTQSVYLCTGAHQILEYVCKHNEKFKKYDNLLDSFHCFHMNKNKIHIFY